MEMKLKRGIAKLELVQTPHFGLVVVCIWVITNA
jgi:hypothetical protein